MSIRLTRSDVCLLIEALDALDRERWRSERAHDRIAHETKKAATRNVHERAAEARQRESAEIDRLKERLEVVLLS